MHEEYAAYYWTLASLSHIHISFCFLPKETGFCLPDQTLFEGVTVLTWFVTEVDSVASVPCPSGTATRECDTGGVWLEPDTTACDVTIDNIVMLVSL